MVDKLKEEGILTQHRLDVGLILTKNYINN